MSFLAPGTCCTALLYSMIKIFLTRLLFSLIGIFNSIKMIFVYYLECKGRSKIDSLLFGTYIKCKRSGLEKHFGLWHGFD